MSWVFNIICSNCNACNRVGMNCDDEKGYEKCLDHKPNPQSTVVLSGKHEQFKEESKNSADSCVKSYKAQNENA